MQKLPIKIQFLIFSSPNVVVSSVVLVSGNLSASYLCFLAIFLLTFFKTRKIRLGLLQNIMNDVSLK